MVSGNFNITVGDISGRRMAGWNENIMIATVPVEKVQGIADAIGKSTAGTARPSKDFEKITASIKAMRNK
jgi:translation elongation factor EF-G